MPQGETQDKKTNMRCIAFGYTVLLLVAATAATSAAAPLLRPNDRLAICGDRITADLGYSVHVEDYLLMCQPVEGLDVAQFGWGGQTAEDFLARLDTDLSPFKPTIVMTCFGVTDGGHKALDDDTANRYRKAQTDMVAALRKSGVRTIVLGSPKCVDSFHYHRDPAQAAIYNKTLSALANIAKDVAAKEDVIYADVFNATMAAMVKAKAEKGERYVFDSEDGYRPSAACQLAMAYAFLRALGCDGDIGAITLDYRAGTATCDPQQRIVSLKDNALIVESTRYPFLFLDPQARSDSVHKFIPFHEDLNRYRLVVTNLPSPRVKVSWNMTPYSELRAHESRDFTAEEIGKGINLAAAFDHIPFGPFGDVTGAVRDQQQQERKVGAEYVANNRRDVQEEAKRDEYIRTAWKRFVPVAHKFRFQPLSLEEEPYRGPINVIVDTDMSGDCDDAGAVALLNSFMNQGEAKLVACVVNGRDADLCSGAAVQAINAYYGHPSIPIGANHGRAWIGPTKSHYTLKIHQRFNPEFPTDDKLPAGVAVYRQALASAADGTVVVVTIGLMENLLDLLNSKPDEISELSGLDLVRKKVRMLVDMANTTRYDNSVLGIWPSKILFTFGVGSYISTGKALAGTPENNPVRCIYGLFGDDRHNALRDGRQSWDLTASWLAVRGPGDLWDVSWGGYWTVDPETGQGEWRDGPQSNHNYILEKMSVPEVVKLMDAELARPSRP